MLEWKDVLSTVVGTLGSDQNSIACVLEFIHVLPEEVTQGRKINLAEDELQNRTRELLEENAQQVLQLLTQYARSSEAAASDPVLMACLTSWVAEVQVNDIVNSPLMDVIVNALQADTSFDEAVETLCAIFKETRDVDESVATIKTLYPRREYKRVRKKRIGKHSRALQGCLPRRVKLGWFSSLENRSISVRSSSLF
jgi:transportin-3